MQVANLFARLGLKVDNGAYNNGLAKINALRIGLVAVGTYLTVKFAGSFISATKEVFEFGDAVDDLATRTGQSAEFLQKLAFAAGGGAEGLGKAQGALDKFGMQLRAAVEDPTNDTAKALKSLGIAIDDPRVRLGNLEQLMQEVADQFERMPNGAQKNSIAFGLMSKSGLEMSQILTEFNAKVKIAQDAGAIMDDDQIKQAAQAKEALEGFEAEWQGLKRSAIVSVMPTIMEGFAAVRDWLRANGPMIRKVIGGVIEFVTEKIKQIVYVVRENMPVVRAAFTVLGVAIAAIGAALTGVIFAAGAALKILEVVGRNIGKFFAWGLTQLIEFWDWLVRVKDMFAIGFSKAGATLAKEWGKFIDLIKIPFVAAWDAVGAAWDVVYKKIASAWETVSGWIDEASDFLGWVGGGGDAKTAAQKRQESLIAKTDSRKAGETARTLLGRGQSQDQVKATLEGIYGKGSNVAATALREATKNVTVNAAPITVTINGANETPENLGLLFQRKIQEAQGSMLRDAAATLGGGV